MSQITPQPTQGTRISGCSPAVIALALLSVLFFAGAFALFLFIGYSGNLAPSNDDDAATVAVNVVQGVATRIEELESAPQDDVANEEAMGEAENPAVAAEGDGVAIEQAIGEAENPAVAAEGDGVAIEQAIGEADNPAVAAEPEPEGTSAVPEAIPYVNEGLGTGAEVYDYYSYGTLVDKPAPYTFVEPGMCGIRTEIFPMPTADLPGATPAEVVDSAFQAEVAASSDKYTWTPLGEPFELELNGLPATRLEVMREEDPDKVAYQQYTVINSEPNSAVVVGKVGNKCYGTVGIENLEILSRVSDTVTLTPQLPVCYVGKDPLEEDYSVACDQWGGTGASILMKGDHSEVVLGPRTWNECARFMREHNQVGWEES